VAECHRLRRKPLAEFTIEDLRIMIGQGISLEILVPIAVERLLEEPLAEGDYYPGDLLVSCAKTPVEFWRSHRETAEAMRTVLSAVRDAPDEIKAEVDVFRQRLARV
jgi:hypothetical protein